MARTFELKDYYDVPAQTGSTESLSRAFEPGTVDADEEMLRRRGVGFYRDKRRNLVIPNHVPADASPEEIGHALADAEQFPDLVSRADSEKRQAAQDKIDAKAAKKQDKIDARLAIQASNVDRDELRQAHALHTQAKGLAKDHQTMLDQFDASAEGTALAQLAKQKVADQKAAAETKWFSSAPTADALEAQSRLVDTAAKRDALEQKRARLQEQAERAAKMSATATDAYTKLNQAALERRVEASPAALPEPVAAPEAPPARTPFAPNLADTSLLQGFKAAKNRIDEIDQMVPGMTDRAKQPLFRERRALQRVVDTHSQEIATRGLTDQVRGATPIEAVETAGANAAAGAGESLLDAPKFVDRQMMRLANGVKAGLNKVFGTNLHQLPIDSTPFQQYLGAMKATADSWGPDVPEQVKEQLSKSVVVHDLAHGLGGIAGMVGPGEVLGAANEVGKTAKLAAKARAMAETTTFLGTGAASTANSMRDDALAKGATPGQADVAEAAGATLGLSLAAAKPLGDMVARMLKVPPGKLFVRGFLKKLEDEGPQAAAQYVGTTGKKALARTIDAIGEASGFSLQQAGQKLGENVASLPYDPNHGILDNVDTAGASGFLLGALSRGVKEAHDAWRARRAPPAADQPINVEATPVVPPELPGAAAPAPEAVPGETPVDPELSAELGKVAPAPAEAVAPPVQPVTPAPAAPAPQLQPRAEAEAGKPPAVATPQPPPAAVLPPTPAETPAAPTSKPPAAAKTDVTPTEVSTEPAAAKAEIVKVEDRVAVKNVDGGKRRVEKRLGDKFDYESDDDNAFSVIAAPSITLEKAKQINPSAKVGDHVVTRVTKKGELILGRVEEPASDETKHAIVPPAGSSAVTSKNEATPEPVEKPAKVATRPGFKMRSPEAHQKVVALADQVFEGLLDEPKKSAGETQMSTPEASKIAQVALPKERRELAMKLADTMLDGGVKTPEDMVSFLDENVSPAARKFHHSLWSLLRYSDPSLPDVPDWSAVHGAVDKPAPKAEVAANERGPGNPESVNPRPTGSAVRAEGAGDRGGLGEQQPVAGEEVGGGRKPGETPAGGSGSGASVDRPSRPAGDDAPLKPREDGNVRRTRVESGEVAPAGNYRITDEDRIGEGGLKTKFSDNVAAIKVLRTLATENRAPTTAEKKQLVRHVGWGGLKGAFDPESVNWQAQYSQLKQILTPQEFEDARASVLNAHYTSPTVVRRGVYGALKHFGFPGGKMIEGGVGTGHFIGMMPEGMRPKTSYVGVERDPLTAKIAQHLYPEAKIHAMRFEDAALEPGTFDAFAGNPPFGDTNVSDKNFKEASKHSLHNYFILKQLDLLRPGGVGAVVVSHHFLDAVNSAAREAIAKRADFVGAIRLPNTAFKQNANTEVTTDLVFFRKRALGDEPATMPDWVKVKKVKDKKTGEPITLNSWLAERPHMMLGEMTLGGKMYGRSGDAKESTLEPRPGQDLGKDLDEAVKSLPGDLYRGAGADARDRLSTSEPVDVPEGTPIGSYFVDAKGQVRRRTPEVNMEKQNEVTLGLKDKEADRIKGTIKIRDAMNRLIAAERSAESTDASLKIHRAALNNAYNDFVKNFGYLNSATNRRAFFDDSQAMRVLGLEKDFDPGVSAMVAKKQGVDARESSAKKSALFSQRLNQPHVEITSVGTPKEALAVTLNQRGLVDVDHMADLTGKTPEEVLESLKGLVFETPAGGYESKEQYLSGNVRAKLKAAEEALERTKDAKWKTNVDALTAVIPKDVKPTDIAVPAGAPWVPASDLSDFAKELTEHRPSAVVYRKSDGGWLFTHNDLGRNSTEIWGTKDASFGDLFSDILNGRPTIITYKDSEGKTHTDDKATALASAKTEEIKAKFADWIFSDQARRERLARHYNDNFNNYVDPKYDGSHLELPGINPNIALRQHQKNVMWRTITDRNTLYDHVVGAGKTFAGVGAFMEMKRMGLVRKPLFIVPNHLTRQWRDSFVDLYPNANVLHTGPSDFDKQGRQKLFAKILTGDYDAVIIGHSQAKKIGVNPEVEKQLLGEMISEITESIEAMKKAEGKRGSRAVAQAEKTKERLTAKLKDLSEVGKRDDVATFDELGIDGMFVDEAHEFKNLFYTTQMQRVAGLGNPAGSQKAFDLYMKTRYLKSHFKGKAPLVFATGTPISNSLVEMFTMQRYLQPDVLEQMGLKTLDAWAKVFASIQHVHEVDPTGTGYRMATRLAEFQNVGELAATYRTVADVITAPDLQQQAELEGKRFPVPKVKGGKPQNIVAPRSPEQEAYFGVEEPVLDGNGNPTFDSEGNPITTYPPGTILHRIDNMPQDPRKDNMLKLTSDARKAGLDMRLIHPNAPDRPESKINEAVRKIVALHKATEADKGTQLVFCDLSVPASARGKATAKAKEQANEFYFIRQPTGKIVQAEGATPVNIEAAPDMDFFVRKSDNGGWIVTERSSGKTVAGADTKKDAVSKANDTINRFGLDPFKANVAKQSAPIEEVTAARDAWMQEKAAEEPENEPAGDESADAPAASEQGVSLDELLADQSTFSVYDDMKAKLIAAGIPANEIAFIHDYDTPDKKAKLFASVNRGDVRILFGSTPKMGAGTNVQKRMVGLHHMDAPWRPSDLEQREGRGIRQGNMFYERAMEKYKVPQEYDTDPDAFALEVNRYATNQTYDTRMWQLIEHKARGIEGFRKADRSTRRIEDVSGEASNASDMKAAASGDPAIQKEIELRNERAKLELLKKAWAGSRHEMQSSLAWYKGADQHHKSEVAAAQKLIDSVKPKPDPFAFVAADGNTLDKKEGIAAVVAGAIKTASESPTKDAVIGKYRGYDVAVELETKFTGETMAQIVMKAESAGPKAWERMAGFGKDDTISDVGFIQRLDNYLDGFKSRTVAADATLAHDKQRVKDLEEDLQKPFPKEEQLVAVRAEHTAARDALLNKKKKKPAAEVQPSTSEPKIDTESPSAFTFRDVNVGEVPKSVTDALDTGGAHINRQRIARGLKPVTFDPVALDQRGYSDQYSAADRGAGSDGEGALVSSADKESRPGKQVAGEAAKEIRSNVGNGVSPEVALSVVHRELQIVFGKRIQFFRPSEPIAQAAFTSPSHANLTFVNADAPAPFLALTGHEFTHNLKSHRPDLYRSLATFVDAIHPMMAGYRNAKSSDYTPEQAHDEWISDVVGQRFKEPEFWEEAARIAKERGIFPAFLRLARAALDWLSKIKKRFENAISQYVTDDIIEGVEKLRTKIAETMHDYAAGAPEGGYPDNTKLSQSTTDSQMSTAEPTGTAEKTEATAKRTNEPVKGREGHFYRMGPDTERAAGLKVVRQIYERRGQKPDLELANEIIDSIGLEGAAKLVLSPNKDNGMDPVAREALIIRTQERATDDAKTKTGMERAKLLRLVQRISNEHNPELTEMGQTISMRQNFSKMDNAAGVIDQATRDTKTAQDAALGGKNNAEADLKAVADALNQVSKSAIDKATAEMNKALRALKVGKEVWKRYREDAADKLLAFVDGRLNQPREKGPLEEFVNDVVAELRSRIASAVKQVPNEAPEKPTLEILKDAIENAEKYKEAWQTAREKIEAKYKDRPKMLEAIDLAMANIDAKPYSKKLLDAALKEAHEAMMTTVEKVAREHWTEANRVNRELVDALVNQAGLKPEDAKAFAEDLITRATQATAEAKKAALDRIVKRHGATMKTREIVDAVRRAVELNNLGALDDTTLRDVVAKKLQLPRLTDDQLSKLAELADKVSTATNDMAKARAEIELMKQMKIYRGTSAIDLLTSIWYANALSSPATHIANASGNTVSALQHVGSLMATNPRQIGKAMSGFGHGLSIGLTDARAMMATGEGLRDFSDKVGGAGQTLEHADARRDLPAWVPGKGLINLNAKLLRYVGRAMRAADSVFFHAAKEAYIDVATAKILASEMRGKALHDAVRKTLSIPPDVWESVRKQAEDEGWKGTDLGLRIAGLIQKKRMEQIAGATGEQSKAIAEGAQRFGEQATLNQTPEGLAGVVYQGLGHIAEHARVKGVPVLKPFMMFLKVPTNLFNNSLNLTPIGAMRAWRGSTITGVHIGGGRGVETEHRQYDSDERSRMFAQSVIGSALMGILAAAALSGSDDDERDFDITAKGPDDFNHRQQLEQTGWRPYSIKKGGKWISYKDTPLVIPLALVGHYVDAVRYRKADEKDIQSRLFAATRKAPAAIFDTSMLQGLSTLGDWIQGNTTGDQALSFGARQIVGMQPYVPATNLLAAIDRTFDTTARENDAPGGAATAAVPFARRLGSPKIDILGEAIHRTPFDRFSSSETDDPLREVLRDKRVFISTPAKDTKLGKAPMTPAQLRDYKGLSGTAIRHRLDPLVPRLRTLEPEKAEDIVKKIVDQERKKAKELVRRGRVFEMP